MGAIPTTATTEGVRLVEETVSKTAGPIGFRGSIPLPSAIVSIAAVAQRQSAALPRQGYGSDSRLWLHGEVAEMAEGAGPLTR